LCLERQILVSGSVECSSQLSYTREFCPRHAWLQNSASRATCEGQSNFIHAPLDCKIKLPVYSIGSQCPRPNEQ